MKEKTFAGLIACWLLPWAFVNCEAADIITAQSGSWTNTATWVGGVVPVQGDQVTIKTGHSVTIPSSGIKSCSDLMVEAGGKLYANTGGSQRYVDIYGNITCNGTIGNGNEYDGISFNIEGAECLISGNGDFDASRIRKNAGQNATTTLTIGMNVNLGYNGTAIFNNKSATNFHIVLNPGCTLDCCGNSGSPGNVCIDGTSGSNGSSYGGSFTVNGTLTVSGILYLTTDNNSTSYTVSFTINSGGTVNTASAVCTNSGSACHYTTVNDGGMLNFTSGDWGVIGITNNEFSFGPASTIEYSGGGAQNVGSPAEYGHLIIGGSGEKTVFPSDLIIHGDLSVNAGSCLIIPQSRAVTLEGNFYLNPENGLVLKAGDPVSAPGSFINFGTIGGTGSVKAEKFVSGYTASNDANYHLISSPVQSQGIQPEFVSDPPESSTDFFRWDEPQSQWINSKNTAGSWNTEFQSGDIRNFIPGCGYLIAYASDMTKSFSGSINSSDFDAAVTSTPGPFSGYNLVGNPFTSALTANIHNWAKTNIRNAVWVWDPASGNYKTWNGMTGTLENGIIPAMEGFFVNASAPFPSMVIPAASRTHSGQPAYKSQAPQELKISLSGRQYYDECILYNPGQENRTADTVFNVEKLMGFQDAPQLYFLSKSGLFSILQADSLSSNWVIPLGIQKGNTDSLRFEFRGIGSFSDVDDIYFEDRLEGQTLDLKEDSIYDFNSCQAIENDRFFLHHKNTTGVGTSTKPSNVLMYSEKGDLLIKGMEDFMGLESLCVYDMQGRKVMEQLIPSGVSRIHLHLAPSYYVVHLTANKQSVSKKLLFTNN